MKSTHGLFLFLSLFSISCLDTFGTSTKDPSNPTDPTNPNNPTNPTTTASHFLKKADSCDSIRDHLTTVLTEKVLQWRFPYYGDFLVLESADALGSDEASDSATTTSASASPTDFTTTNTQEADVDEADIVKTDGKYIYTLSDTNVIILQSWPAEETKELSRISLKNETDISSSVLQIIASDVEGGGYYNSNYIYPENIFYFNDTIVVISRIYDSSFSGTRVSLINITDRSLPVLTKQFDVEADYVSARLINNNLYLVSRGNFDYWDKLNDLTDGVFDGISEPFDSYNINEDDVTARRNESRDAMKEKIKELLKDKNINDFFPTQRTVNSEFTVTESSSLLSCTNTFMPTKKNDLALLTVSHLDLNNTDTPFHTNLLANGWEIYASKDNLYIGLSSRSWWWFGRQENESHIHKFSLTGKNNHPEYVASGKVDGWFLNQFSMSEYNGYLRIATTDNDWTWDEQDETSSITGGNNVFILKETDGELTTVGSITGLAPGEQIYSTRFVGDKGFVVTFRQTDPLYTMDLSDPKNPQLLGELKINGFSTYMHPWKDNFLVTVGLDATDEGQTTSPQLQLFDISDMSNPKLTFKHTLGNGNYAWSESLYNHHAFTFHAEKGLLAIPMSEYGSNYNGFSFTGLIVFQVDETSGFHEIGRVDHYDIWENSSCSPTNTTIDESCYYRYAWNSHVRRSIFIEDYLYSLSGMGLKVNELYTPGTELVSVKF